MLFRQPIKIQQSISIWLGLDTSFNGIRQDKRIISKKIRYHFFGIFIDELASKVQ